MNYGRIVTVVTALFTVMNSHNVCAAFVMTLDDINDGFAPTVIYDGSASDLVGLDGVISYTGSVGAFSVNVTTGVSKPEIGPARLELNSIDVSGSSGALVLGVTDTDFSFISPGRWGSVGGRTDGVVEFSFLYDINNGEFAGDEIVNDRFHYHPMRRAFSNDYEVVLPGESSLYSLSILAKITHPDGIKTTSLSAEISPVPVPAGALLFVSALAGLICVRRVKTKK